MSQGRLPRLLACLLLCLLLPGPGCGGGGGGTGSVAPAVVDLGTVAATLPTVTSRGFRNPLFEQATVTEPVLAGPYRISPGSLPAVVAAGATVTLPVVLTPPGPGEVPGEVRLLFSGSLQSAQVAESYTALVETPSTSANPTLLDFGNVARSTSRDVTTRISNASALSPVTFTSISAPSPEVSVSAPGLPFTVPAGGQVDVTLRVTSTAGARIQGPLTLGPTDLGGALALTVEANLSPPEIVTDFGSVAFVGSDTGVLQVSVPSDAISLSLEAVGGATDTFGLAELTGPGAKVYENTSSTGAYIWMPGQEVFTAQVPNTDRTDVQLVPGGGTYSFRIRRLGGSATSCQVRAIVEQRPGASNVDGALDLNIWFAQGLTIDASTAATDTRLASVLASLDSILAGQGVRLGAITYYDVTDPTYDFVTNSEFPGLLALSSSAAVERLNLFFVREALGGGVVGVAGTIGGPRINGTSVSGVMSVYEGFSTGTIALVAAHEIGHFLGLYHTVEQTGSHDFVDDTAQCAANGPNAACPTAGGGYLMHWQALGGTTITNGQGRVLRGHPLVDPLPSGTTKPSPAPAALKAQEVFELWGLEERWCGCCRAAAEAKR